MTSWNVYGQEISSVGIVDDEAGSRQSLGWVVNDASLSAMPFDGPWSSLDGCLAHITASADAFVCDHHLRIMNYANFDGAELVAGCTRLRRVSVLCTRYTGTDMTSIRPYLPLIPVLVRPDELNEPDELFAAFEECATELAGNVSQERKGWRTQVVVERVDETQAAVDVSVPAWPLEESVRIRLADLPDELRASMKVGYRCHAFVNLGTEAADRLFVHRWEF